MSKYAIIETGGKQYRVEEGQPVITERLPDSQAGSKVAFDRVLVIGAEGKTKIGQPYVKGAKVSGTVAAEFKGEKIKVFKYKRKTRQARRRGHRQIYTKTLIQEIRG
ncbi:MAG: 50S ribosomal protein L21 [Candidatus Fraserbacteria bacterium RBG_16_55_9]|uniref:Large ribosomal subunit protein bL21 n=1 Tax=Fraserbacteria sp. (strain RBG_16_55_9) TaxID=1817864 RepID=A0A1F5UVH7_FRAXR|nr:MAG: 50S ribosomal protein L21 [Candidatus Fraserbacteria bacterium RBG_16_55_9]